MSVSGGCHCGAVRYECTSDPVKAGHCQCKNCQKFTGTGHAVNVLVMASDFTVTGECSTYEYKAESGNTMLRYFCPKCGTPTHGTSSGNDAVVVIRAGSMDDPSKFDAAFVLFVGEGQAWDSVPDDIPHFPGMPG